MRQRQNVSKRLSLYMSVPLPTAFVRPRHGKWDKDTVYRKKKQICGREVFASRGIAMGRFDVCPVSYDALLGCTLCHPAMWHG